MNEQDKLNLILKKIDEQSVEIATIKRGVYGDPLNGQLGLLDRQKDDERRLFDLETSYSNISSHQKKFFAIVSVAAGGFISAIEVAWHFYKERVL